MSKYLRIAYIIICVLAVLIGMVLYVNLTKADHILIVHFDSFRGIDFLGKPSTVWGIYFFALAISAINIWLSRVFHNRLPFFSYLFAYFTIFFWILISIAIAVIISVN